MYLIYCLHLSYCIVKDKSVRSFFVKTRMYAIDCQIYVKGGNDEGHGVNLGSSLCFQARLAFSVSLFPCEPRHMVSAMLWARRKL